MKSSLALNYVTGYNDNKFQFATLRFCLYKNIFFIFKFNNTFMLSQKMWWQLFLLSTSSVKVPFFFLRSFETNCKITELSASPIIQISLWEKHARFILLCLLSMNALYLGKLNPNSFSLFLLFFLCAKRIMLVSCLVSIQCYKSCNTNIHFCSLCQGFRPSIVILWC